MRADNIALAVLVISASVTCGYVTAQSQYLPSFSVSLNGRNATSTSAETPLTVTANIGDTVTLACYYDATQDPQQQTVVSISKAHPNKQQQPQRQLLLVTNGQMSEPFATIRRNSPLAERYSASVSMSDTTRIKTVYLNVSDFQLEDVAEFLCKVNVKNKTTTANISVKIVPSVFTVSIAEQQLELKDRSDLSVSCQIYRSETTNRAYARFDICDVRADVYERTPNCNFGADGTRTETKSVYDYSQMPYSEFWQRVIVRDEYSATFNRSTLTTGQTIACMSHNKPTKTLMRDYAALVRVNDRLVQNPFNFNCSKADLEASTGAKVTFECNVSYSAYREPQVVWEIAQPDGKVLRCSPSTNCSAVSKNLKQDQSDSSFLTNRYERVTRSVMEVVCDETTSTWRFHVTEQYSEHMHRSTAFTVRCGCARLLAGVLIIVLQVAVLIAKANLG